MWAKNKNRAGFTIIELLIVVVVIGILAAIVIVAYNGIQARGRDAKRNTDIAAIKKALELYKIDNGGYPLCGASGVFQPNTATYSVCPVTGITQLYSGKYLPSGVVDPINAYNYQYQYAAGFRNDTNGCATGDYSNNYILGATLEAGGNVPSYTCWSIIGLNYKSGTNN